MTTGISITENLASVISPRNIRKEFNFEVKPEMRSSLNPGSITSDSTENFLMASDSKEGFDS